MRLHRRNILRAAPGLVIAGLAGCAAPPAQYFRLEAVAGSVTNIQPQTIRVRDISIPGYLAQNGIAKTADAYEFAVFDNDLWAEPLADMLQSTLVQNLTQRLPACIVTGSRGAVGTPAGLLIELNVLRFEPDATGRVTLQAQVALKSSPGGAFLVTKTLAVSAMPAGSGAAGIVAAMSLLWGQLTDDIVDLIANT
jgi:uncharacterized lipoprotein YmbA